MMWSGVFWIGIVQGLFLIAILVFRQSRNRLATRLLVALIVPILMIHAGYLVIRTDAFHTIPQVFGLSFGTMFLFGPLLYLYGRSVLDAAYHWRHGDWLHFLPFGIQFALNIPFLLQDAAVWEYLIKELMSDRLTILPWAMTSYGLQTVHLVAYLLYTARMVGRTDTIRRFLVPVETRIVWSAMFGLNCLEYSFRFWSCALHFTTAYSRIRPISTSNRNLSTRGMDWRMVGSSYETSHKAQPFCGKTDPTRSTPKYSDSFGRYRDVIKPMAGDV